jgi:hypothetical protein
VEDFPVSGYRFETDAERRLRAIRKGAGWAFYLALFVALTLGVAANDWPFVQCVLLALIANRLFSMKGHDR